MTVVGEAIRHLCVVETSEDEMKIEARVHKLELAFRDLQRSVTALVTSATTGAAPPSPVATTSNEAVKRMWPRWIGKNALGGGALLVAVLAWLQPQWHADSQKQTESIVDGRIDQKLKEPLGLLTTQGKQLAAIQSSIDSLERNLDLVLKKELKIAASLSQSDFDKNLDLVAVNTEVASRRAVRLEPAILQSIKTRLAATQKETPDRWSAVSHFITFATNGSSSKIPPVGTPVNLRIQSTPPLTANIMPEGLVVELIGGEINGLHFKDCRIKFTGKAVRMFDVSFDNCAFEFPAISNPTPYLERAAKTILASNLTSVVLTIG